MFSGWRLVVCLGLLLLCYSSVSAQQYLVLDRYGRTRVKVPMGSEIIFKLKGDKRKHQSRIVAVADSVVIMGDLDIYLKFDDFETFYFHRPHWKALRYGTLIPAAGFLIGAAVHPLVSNAFYDQQDSAIIGLGFLALGQSFRLFEWKKFKVNKNARIWVGGIE